MHLLGAVMLSVVAGAGVALAESSQPGSSAVTGSKTNQVKSAAAGATTNDRPDIITLASNKYERCKITRVEPSAITVFHSKGIARIRFVDLPEIWRKKYNYDPEKALAYEQELAQQRQRQGKPTAESAKPKPEATPTSSPEAAVGKAAGPEPSAGTTPPKTTRAQSVEEAIDRSKKTARRGIGAQDVPMPLTPF
jgi:hypothetical protein